MDYVPSAADAAFLLFDVVDTTVLQELPRRPETDRELMTQVLEEAGKFVAQRIAPLHRIGDESGCRFVEGVVCTPPGFRQAYQAFAQGGWPSLACEPEDGGQGLPQVLAAILYEWLSGANHAWTMAPALLHGAYECLKHHGGKELTSGYLRRLASGEWLPTMCLTEAQAGSDLGLVTARGQPQPDGSYRVSGTKIFISSGEHDLTENIIHLVLARQPDAPAGAKGLSLFLVPKVLPDGSRNAAYCERIEEKMGLHGSPTCVMRFEAATGWLVGESNRGLAAMFVMMNAARLHVALQGIGLLDAAWQKAHAYALERRQMRAPGRRAAASAPDLIIEHPAMRRALDTQRAWIDAGRVLAYRTGIELDVAKHHPSAARRACAQRWNGLVTPVLKAAFTQQAFDGSSACLQVFGGHGYVRESGIEQVVRDARVTMIYEGTNEIQAIDLLMRKVLADQGEALAALLDELVADLRAAPGPCAEALDCLAQLRELTMQLCNAVAGEQEPAYWIAGDYLRAVALALMAWAWARIGGHAEASAQPQRWQAGARAFRQWVLPEFAMRLAMIRDRLRP